MAAERERLGHYRLVRVLGRGGMGVVHEGWDERVGRSVAIKVLSADGAVTPDAIRRFEREAQAAARVQHPNVVVLHDSIVEGDTRALVHELVPGGSIADRLKKEGALPWREAARLGAGIASGLAAVHDAGLVHRDLKPANILIDTRGEPRVADFGVARLGPGPSSLTHTGQLVGTLEYLAPELAEGGTAVGPAADLYALGATLHEMLAGAPPFAGTGFMLVKKHLHDAPPSVRTSAPSVPEPLARFVLRLLAKKPTERGVGARAVARELAALALLPEPVESASRNAWLLAALIVLGAAVAGTALVVARRAKPVAPPTPATVVPDKRPPPPPAWFLALDAAHRPRLPLPADVHFGPRPREYVNGRDGSLLVYVPAGPFRMGRKLEAARLWGALATRDTFGVARPDALPVRTVELSAYFVGEHEVAVWQYRKFVAANPALDAVHDSHGVLVEGEQWSGTPIEVSWSHPDGVNAAAALDAEPVSSVSWREARAYCKWAGLALATEAQWEKAALWDPERSAPRLFPWGDEPPDAQRARANLRDRSMLREWPGAGGLFPWDDGFPRRAPVGSLPDDCSFYGARDMAGNVQEWVEDTYVEPYDESAGADPVVTREGENRAVVRGGSWADYPEYTPPAMRNFAARDEVRDDRGFRVALREP